MVMAPLLHRLRSDQASLGVLLQILQRGRILSYCVPKVENTLL